MGDARRRAELKFGALAPIERSDREFKVFEVAMKLIDLGKNGPGLDADETPAAP